MTLVKTDRPRRIDQCIDFFGEPHGAPSGPPPNAGAVDGLLTFTGHLDVVRTEARAV